jgi:antirestriction protein ArdC
MSNVYETVTTRIIAELEQGTAPWAKPWKGSGIADLPYNALTGRRYNGVNVLLLWDATLTRGYHHASWLTFLQAKALGGQVKKGEHATAILFAGSSTKKDEAGEEEKHRFLRFHSIFNVEQVGGLPERFTSIQTPRPLDEALIEAEDFIAALGADVRHGGNMAAYSPALDCILLPHREQFESDAHYAATKLHEHGHWTGHKSRLDRDLTGRFGDQAYAGEELIAELTAAFLCAELAIPGQLRHPEYIGSWLKVLGKDTRAIFTAAGKATEAANYMRSIARPESDSKADAVDE